MASKEGSIDIKTPPTASLRGAVGGTPDDREGPDPDLGDAGLLSSTPSSVPQQQGPHFAHLEHLMTVIETLRRENTELRNHLHDQNLLIEHKSKNLEQINDNYRQYDELVKQKHRETAEKFRAMKEQYEKLKEELRQAKEGLVAGGEAGEKDMGSWTAVEVQGHHTDDEFDTVKHELTEEKQKSTNLSESLRKERAARESAEAKLGTAFNDLAKIREERKRENQELRKSMSAEVSGYKQQVQSLISELAESKRNLTLHSKKVQELHEANLQFDQVNSAYHEKLALYEEELKKRDDYIDKLKQEFYNCNQQLKQQLQTEKHDKQSFEDEVAKLQETVEKQREQLRTRVREFDNLTARNVSMDESLQVRDTKLKDSKDTINMLNAQLKQYQEDFEHERLAREHTYQESLEKQQEITNLREKVQELQETVDRYTQNSVRDLGRQYNPQSPTSPPFSPQSPPHVPYGGDRRGFDWEEQHRGDQWGRPPQRQEDQTTHKCPMCPEEFAESGSLQIHVNTHFE